MNTVSPRILSKEIFAKLAARVLAQLQLLLVSVPTSFDDSFRTSLSRENSPSMNDAAQLPQHY